MALSYLYDWYIHLYSSERRYRAKR